ncbi:hypothetical protein JOS77_01410 [Chromobacterium haemolyticum]|nr:hypothetical protein JOS77_01410 [Chromobacterium haemolyticum]
MPAATAVIEDFAERYQAHWLQQARRKLGLSQAQDIDQELAEDWLALLARQDADHTLAWRRLADAAEGRDQALTQLFNDPPPPPNRGWPAGANGWTPSRKPPPSALPRCARPTPSTSRATTWWKKRWPPPAIMAIWGRR